MNSVVETLVLIVVVAALTACGAPSGDTPPATDGGVVATDGGATTVDAASAAGGTCGRSGRSGISDCFATECGAGQYCEESGGATSGACMPGCTSDENCAANDFCARAAGVGLGVCQSCVGERFEPAHDGCVDVTRTGISDCFATDCAAGAWCDEAGGPTSGACAVGCTSDVNCGPAEYCVRNPGASVGVCESCYPRRLSEPGPAGLCERFTDRGIACGLVGSDVRGVAISDCESDTSGRFAELAACYVDAVDCVAGAACFPRAHTPEEIAACQSDCASVGTHCTDQLSFRSAEVGACVATCETVLNITAMTACLRATLAGPPNDFFGCSDAAACGEE